MLELEGRAVTEGVLNTLVSAMTDHGLDDLWQTVAGGYAEMTPSGGVHYYYRTDCAALPNAKLARRPSTPEELAAHQEAERAKLDEIADPELRQRRADKIDSLTPADVPHVLIETRGEGGWSIVAPSTGRTHPTGQPWRAIVGTPLSVPVITGEQREAIHAVASLLDLMPERDVEQATPTHSTADPTRLRPGDDYNARATWDEILIPHGWQRVAGSPGRPCSWVRPGKSRGDGISATTGRNEHDRLYVFSSSAAPFETERPYDKLGAYALLEHGGDIAAAVKALAASGYGDQTPIDTTLTLVGGTVQRNVSDTSSRRQTPMTSGSSALATVTQLQPAILAEPTEDALALAFVNQVAETVRYVPQRSMWITWTGSHWAWDEVGAHREHIKAVARRLPSSDKTEAAFRRKMLSSAGISGVANMARTDSKIVVHIDDLDAHPWELNTPGGIVDLRTGKLSPPDPSRLHTRSTAVAPDFDAPAPLWTRFLDDTFGGDQEMIGYAQRVMGVSVIGKVVEQILPFGIGVGANGKSVYVETCTAVLSRGERGYSISASAEMLMARRYQEHSAELAQLAGARLVVCSEVDEGARFAEAKVKLLTGSDSISARFMRENFFTFTPSHTFFLVANHRPMATVGGLGFWRRLRLIPFHHVVPEDRRDPHLPEKLRDEWSAILAWIIRGAADYAAGGMQTPASVTAATDAYARDEDTMQRFVDEECHLSPGSDLVRIRTSKLREAYERACREVGDEPVSARRFTQELRDRFGVTSARSNGQRFSLGITLIEVPDDHDDEPDDASLFGGDGR